MSEPFIGEIRMVGFSFVPRGWALCNGQILQISDNSALFALLGTIYGGDGRSTFALPDLRGRVPIHFGQGPGLSNFAQGAKGGSETNTLTINELPAHSHGVAASNGGQTTNRPKNGYLAAGNRYTTAAPPDTEKMAPTDSAGGGQPINNREPYLVANFVIALVGLFPSRS